MFSNVIKCFEKASYTCFSQGLSKLWNLVEIGWAILELWHINCSEFQEKLAHFCTLWENDIVNTNQTYLILLSIRSLFFLAFVLILIKTGFGNNWLDCFSIMAYGKLYFFVYLKVPPAAMFYQPSKKRIYGSRSSLLENIPGGHSGINVSNSFHEAIRCQLGIPVSKPIHTTHLTP